MQLVSILEILLLLKESFISVQLPLSSLRILEEFILNRLLYIYFLKWFAKIIAWLSILAILVSLIALGAYTWS